MLTKNGNRDTDTMLIMEYGSTCVCASGKKFGKFNNLLRFRALFGTICRVIYFLKISDVCWHVKLFQLFSF